MAKRYPWRRFWCPVGAQAQLDQGFLIDPEGEHGDTCNPHAVASDGVARHPCTILLGGPGSGKSTEIRQTVMVAATAATSEEEVHFADLKETATIAALTRVFEGDWFANWQRTGSRCNLIFDSLDECLLGSQQVTRTLAEILRSLPVSALSRLRLIICCRTVDWRLEFQKSLEDVFASLVRHSGEETAQSSLPLVGAYELLPLRRSDVMTAVREEGGDPEAFLAALAERDAQYLASRPTRLRALISQHRSGLPGGRVELFERACLRDCEEWEEARFDRGTHGKYAAADRLATACRIAALSLLAGKPRLRQTSRSADAEVDELTWDDIGRDNEPGSDGTSIPVTSDLIGETLRTALFTTAGDRSVQFSDRVTQEFLAALHLHRRDVPINQKLQLLRHPRDPTGRVAPPLAEIAAWSADLDPRMFDALLVSDPCILLRSDVRLVAHERREALVAALLISFSSGQQPGRALTTQERYGGLEHPGLAQQLRPFIENRDHPTSARSFAIDVAEACGQRELALPLARLAVDPQEDHSLRANAVGAVALLGDPEAVEQLEPLTRGAAGPDPDDRLRGAALRALWPGKLPAVALFDRLAPPARDSTLSSYQWFLSHELPAALRKEDLPVALDWCFRVNPADERELPYPFEDLRQGILKFAWSHLDDEEVVTRLAKGIAGRLDAYMFFPDRLGVPAQLDAVIRRKILLHVLHLLNEPQAADQLAHTPSGLLSSEDCGWVFTRAFQANPEQLVRNCARLLRALCVQDPLLLSDEIISAVRGRENPILSAELAPWIDEVPLNAPVSLKLKRDYYELRDHIELSARRRTESLLEPPAAEQVATFLQRCEDDPTDFWQLLESLKLERSWGDLNRLWATSDITGLPGWLRADDALRHQIIGAARRYLLHRKTEPSEWLGKNIYDRPDHGGFPALRLMLRFDREFVEGLTNERWQNWAPVLFGFPSSSGVGNAEEQDKKELIALAYQRVPRAVVDALLRVIDRENERGDHVFVLRDMEHCWPLGGPLAEDLCGKASDPALKPSCMGCILSELLTRQCGDARAFAASLLRSPVPTSESATERARVAAVALWRSTPDCGWPVVWPAIQSDAQFGKEVLGEIAASPFLEDAALTRLAEGQLAEVFLWLAEQFPVIEGVEDKDGEAVELHDSIVHLRDNVLSALVGRGTAEAVDRLQAIASRRPHLKYLPRMVALARDTMLERTWRPIQPAQLRAVLQSRAVGLVRSDEELVEVVVAALDELQQDLQGETPVSRFLWDQIGEKDQPCWRPVGEESLSDFVKFYLEKRLTVRGIAAAREVVIRKGEVGPGERTDLQIIAAVKTDPEAHETVRAIVETKGCWHDDVLTAMEGQLVNRYLRDNVWRCGIYLVGWFDQTHWDPADRRRGRIPVTIRDFNHAKAFFSGQASALSSVGRLVRPVVLNCSLR